MRMTHREIVGLARDRPEEARRHVERIVREEAVARPGDLLRRRTEWDLTAEDPLEIRRLVEEWLPES